MSHRSTPLPGPLVWLLALGLVVAVAAVACGGDSKKPDSEPITEAEAATASNTFLKTTLGLFTGTAKAEDFVNLFKAECREKADVQTLQMVLTFIQGFAPDIQGLKIEDVDLGPLVLEQDAKGTLVRAQNPAALRIKVDGQFKTASEFFGDAGFDEADEETLSRSVLLVREDGKIYLGDCTDLENVTGGL